MNITIAEDTRQKVDKTNHIHEQLERLGMNVVRTKLYAGDYSILTNQTICVDTKYGMPEIYTDLIQQHERFREECARAKEAGIKLIILIQEEEIKSIDDVFKWRNPRTAIAKAKGVKPPVASPTLAKIMMGMTKNYGVEFLFEKKQRMGLRILELLGIIDPYVDDEE